MKKKVFLIPVLVGSMLLASCKNDQLSEVATPSNGETAKLTLTLNLNMKKLANDPIIDGSKTENAMKTATVGLYGEDGNLSMNKTFKLDDQKTIQNLTMDKVTLGTYKVVVFTNSPANEEFSLPQDFNSLQYAPKNVTVDLLKKDGFFMSNHDIESTEVKTGKNNATVNLDRALAKVYVRKAKSSNLSKDYEVSDNATYALDVINKKEFLVRQPDNTRSDLSYVIDPNYNAITAKDYDKFDANFYELTKIGDGALADFPETYANDNTLKVDVKAIPDKKENESAIDYIKSNEDKGSYITENTFAKDVEQKGQVSQVVAKFIIYPKALMSKGGKLGDTWINFMGTLCTKDELNFAIENPENNPTFKNPQQIGLLKGNKDLINKALNPKVENGKQIIEINEVAALFSQGVKIYHNGVVFFFAYIPHAYNQNNPATSTYGVVRNNAYDIVITKLNGPGLPFIPGKPADQNIPVPGTISPTEPIHKAQATLEIQANILPWTIRSTDNMEINSVK